MVAAYQADGDSFVADKPRAWAERRLIGFSTTRTYDPAPDDQHIVALRRTTLPESPMTA